MPDSRDYSPIPLSSNRSWRFRQSLAVDRLGSLGLWQSPQVA
jgi:hypothetical protein